MFAGLQLITEVERVETARDANGVALRFFDGETPGAGPCQSTEPDLAGLFARGKRAFHFLVGVAGNREPRIRLMPGGSPAAFNDALAILDGLLIKRPLAGPTARQIAEGVTRGRKRPLGSGGLLDDHRLLFLVIDDCGASEDSGLRVHGVAKRHIDLARNVFEQDFYGLRVGLRGLNKM